MKRYPEKSNWSSNLLLMQKHNRILFYTIPCLLLFFCILFHCGTGLEGYGVVLWAEKDTGLVNGNIVKVISESLIQDAYIVTGENTKEKVFIKLWRLEFFKSKKEAERFAEKYAPYSGMYAFSEKDGTPPVREIPENSSSVKIISRPKAYQPLKILNKKEEPVKIDEMTDYWYQVLVEYQGIGKDGQYKLLGGKGYCFGHLLEIFQTDGDPEEEIRKRTATETGEDPLENLLNNVFRPVYFIEMINSGRVDPDRFKSAIGFFPEPMANRIVISLPGERYTFDYTDITRVRYNYYSFQGVDLRIEVLSSTRISVTYMVKSGQVNTTFIKINADIDALVERELQIRDALYEDFFIRGPVLTSSAYGKIVLNQDKTFTWINFDKLIPAVIPHEISGRGKIDFPHYISSTLKDNYDGVITFYFTGYSPDAGVNFLYKKTEKGVRLFYVKEELIEERRVTKTDLNPMVIFFTFSGD
ncbi:MAG: hypothetical protein JXB88_22250 [Spirochaetales bacterium]|nr:hypothetical protein [Spirochaetales bacterium]